MLNFRFFIFSIKICNENKYIIYLYDNSSCWVWSVSVTMPKFEDIARLPRIDSKWYFDKDYQVLKWGLFQRFCYITFLKFLSWYILLQKAKFFLKPATSKAQRCSFLGYFFFWWKFVFWRFTQRSWILNISLLFKPWTSKLLLLKSFCDERTQKCEINLFWRSWEFFK